MQLIAQGRTSEIFILSSKKILKLYRTQYSIQDIEREYEKTITIKKQTKLLIPKIHSIEKYGTRYGIVAERINNSTSMLSNISKNPLNLLPVIKRTVAIHNKIHKYKNIAIPNSDAYISSIIKNSKRFSIQEKDKILKILIKFKGNTLCHGDMHPGNLIDTKNGIYTIDWEQAFLGNPALDIAISSAVAVISPIPQNLNPITKLMVNNLKHILHFDKIYTNKYYKKKKPNMTIITEAMLISSAFMLALCSINRNLDTYIKYYRYWKEKQP